ncbi:CinA family protein [Ketobacter sp.]|uniref:CinA family protein n=1 Tax=Ketobacter sp. TaxID=2083498 RepID=UPI0025B90AE8|nr:nicotinamide-nucleotide amidohydrolase family protein [Ketobacter sp.]
MLLYSDQIMLIEALATQLGALLADKNKKIVTAESCTGGWVAQAITQVPGSSLWFDRSFVTYSNDAKRQMLGVKLRTLNRSGAVSREVVEEMASGALKKSAADFSVAISGIAGPDGGTEEKPVGTVWFAWDIAGEVDSSMALLPGSRRDVRAAAVTLALQGLLVRIRKWLADHPGAVSGTGFAEKELTQLLDDSE